ncbi:MAG: DUF5320 domain-containing protein [Bacteroidales bacterium]|nr:DUF5320 domain-containing protein [Bacteroidales bacterium]
MPQGDRTGPMGQGPRTGRGLGFCSGYDTPGYTKGPGIGMSQGFGFGRGFGGGFGRGFGRGMGRGRGYGWGRHFGWSSAGYYQTTPWMQTISKDDEIKMLKSQAEDLKRSQEEIEKRIQELNKGRD